MKTLITILLILISFTGFNQIIDKSQITDSATNLKVGFGTLYEMKVISYTCYQSGDTTIEIKYLKHIPQKGHALGVWYGVGDEIERVFIKEGKVTYGELKLVTTEDKEYLNNIKEWIK